MAQIWEYIKIALMNIKSNKGRSVLTMLGIIIGIASVIMVIAIGNGVRGQVNDELEGLAGGQIAFYVDSTRKETTVTFDQTDFDAIEANIAHVKGVTPQLSAWGTAEGPKGNFDISMTGGDPGLQYTSSEPIVKGRYFSQDDCDAGGNVCVITESSAVSLFGTTDVIGLTFEATFWGVTQEMRVIGVRKDTASSLISMAGGGTNTITAECPLSFMGNKLYYDIDDFSEFYVIADNSAYCTQVAQDTLNLLEARHGVRGENQIMMQSFTAMGVFLMRQFYTSIPDELCEAARIDGLTEYGIYFRVILPLAKGGIATLIISSFVTVWNDFMGPLIYLSSLEKKTLQLGLRMFISQYSSEYNLIMAASIVSLIPVFVMFAALQKFFTEGIAASGIKG